LIEDLKAVGKRVYFWNFKTEPFHVMARYNKENVKLFKYGKTLNDFVDKLDDQQLKNGKHLDVVSLK
jgi:hypothetical protein